MINFFLRLAGDRRERPFLYTADAGGKGRLFALEICLRTRECRLSLPTVAPLPPLLGGYGSLVGCCGVLAVSGAFCGVLAVTWGELSLRRERQPLS